MSIENRFRTTDPAGVSDDPRQQPEERPIARYLWLVLALVAGIAFAAIWALLPHEREGQALWQFSVKIATFVVALAAVSTFPQRLHYGHLLAAVPFFAFLGFIIPKMTYYFLMGPETEPVYYTYLWSVNYPAIMLSIALAFRLGGGRAGRTMKVGLTGLILVFSGYLELMWFVVNPLNYEDMPSIPHVEVIIGHFPSYPELLVFALCHVPLLVLVHLLPLDRWYDRWRFAIAARRSEERV